MNDFNAVSLDPFSGSSPSTNDDALRQRVREISVFVLVLSGFVGMLSMLLANG